MLPSFGWTSFPQHEGYFYPELFSPCTPAPTFPSAVCFKTGSVYLVHPLRYFFFRKIITTGLQIPWSKHETPRFRNCRTICTKDQIVPSFRSLLVGILSNIFAIGRLILKFAFRLPANFPFLASGSTCRLAFVTFPGSSLPKTLAPSSLAVQFRYILSWILLLVEGGDRKSTRLNSSH